MLSKVVIASTNPHKVSKLKWVLGNHFSEIVALDQKIDIEETGKSFIENAEIKALYAAKLYNSYAIGTDAGALIPSLGSNWNGLLTKRFAGASNISDWDRMEALLKLMDGLEGNKRKVAWKEAVAIASPKGIIFSTEVDGDEGLIQKTYKKEQYQEGIWLCTLTSYPIFGGKNFFDLTDKEKEYGEISWWRIRRRVQKYLKSTFSQNSSA